MGTCALTVWQRKNNRSLGRPPSVEEHPERSATKDVLAIELASRLSMSLVLAYVWMKRPPANDQFSQDVSLKQTMTFSVLNPAWARLLMSS